MLQAGRNQHEHIMESIEIFGREVLPEFIDRDEAQVKRQDSSGWRRRSRRRCSAGPRTTNRPTSATTRSRRLPVQWAKATGSAELAATLQQWADDRATGKRDLSAGITG